MKAFRNRISHLLLIFSLIIPSISAANDTLKNSSILRDGETLVSSGGLFELGFFNPEGSRNRYVGIWYRNISVQTVVWVANRQTPLTTNLGVLRVTETGVLALFNGTNGTIIWTSNATRSVGNPSAQLFDLGNLVVKDADDDNPENFLWQSFDHPTDTYVPNMITLGWNLVTGVETYMTSWRGEDDPSPGQFTLHLDPTGYPQVLIKRGETIRYRDGPWNGIRFSGSPAGNVVSPRLRMTKNEIRFGFVNIDQSLVFRARFSPDGGVMRTSLNQRTKSWTNSRSMPEDICDNYNKCGANGICNISSSPNCTCLDKFVPKDPEAWNAADWLNGCVRRRPLNCRGDVFLKYSQIKLPDARNSSIDEGSVGLAECEAKCSKNCSCTAYAQLNISGTGSGCLFYHGDFIDMRDVSPGAQDLYIRMASAEKDVARSKGKKGVVLIASLTSMAGIGFVCLSIIIFCIRKRKRKKERSKRKIGPFSASRGEEAELQFFNLSTILKATDNFSDNNKLGEGGFGPVFKGILEGGLEIAVKRLSKTSSQGVDELKNEVILIAKLHHRNLVRLLGCCIQGEENMLIYEYMPNNSLNLILFDQNNSQLDWHKRFQIINGIAKGLLYLHQDSRLRIVHRDLKASNILLDADMNPKISDFGLARCFGGNDTSAKTRKVVGTYGYMAPEYAMDGLFSIKSDVFSFGVLVLEVASGKRNRGFSLRDYNLNLIQHAWTLYKDDMLWKLVDTSLGDSFYLSEVLRSIHVGLLCVQRLPEDRPDMSSVVFMLGNEVELPEIKTPGFFIAAEGFVTPSSSGTDATHSRNQVTITMPQGR